MRIAIIGAGNVGGALGTAFARARHSVVFGVRDPDSEKSRSAFRSAPDSSAAPVADAVADADVVVFALRWDAVPGTVRQLPSLAGGSVIDALNRFDGDPARSTSQDLGDLLPGARIVKAFDTIGFENLTSAHARATPAVMFVAGDDRGARTSLCAWPTRSVFAPRTRVPSRTLGHSRRWSKCGSPSPSGVAGLSASPSRTADASRGGEGP